MADPIKISDYTQNCGNCRFCRLSGPHKEARYLCQRLPPVVQTWLVGENKNDDTYNYHQKISFPVVELNMWCGEHAIKLSS